MVQKIADPKTPRKDMVKTITDIVKQLNR
jgi:hypothetical protein